MKRCTVTLMLVCLLAGCEWRMPEASPKSLPETAAPTTEAAVQEKTPDALRRAELAVQTFAYENDLPVEAYPESLVELLERNPETEEFVLYYPLEYGQTPPADLSEYEDCESVPLFMQWDRRWGYLDYGADVAGLTACGPVCLSMVAYYFTKDPAMAPDRMIRFAIEHGYCAPGDGSYWSLIDQGGAELGLEATEVEIDEDTALASLEAGNPIICVMGPGDFTASGHFIVMTGVEDGRIRVNDPNSYANSQKLWDFSHIADQILCMWVMAYAG